MSRGRGRAVSMISQCIFFVEWEIQMQVTPLDRPLRAGEGWGEGLPATSVSSISSQPLSECGGWGERRVKTPATGCCSDELRDDPESEASCGVAETQRRATHVFKSRRLRC